LVQIYGRRLMSNKEIRRARQGGFEQGLGILIVLSGCRA
jgi:hypothetical protein